MVCEIFIAGWNDGVYKKVITLLTNILVYKAFLRVDVLRLKLGLGKSSDAERAESIKHALLQEFWLGSYFADWIDNGVIRNNFDTIGNLLAILWGLVEGNKADMITNFLEFNHESFVLQFFCLVY